MVPRDESTGAADESEAMFNLLLVALREALIELVEWIVNTWDRLRERPPD